MPLFPNNPPLPTPPRWTICCANVIKKRIITAWLSARRQYGLWAEADDNATAQVAEGFFVHVFTPPDDEQESAKIFNVLEQIGKGRPLQEIAPELSQYPFFIS